MNRRLDTADIVDEWIGLEDEDQRDDLLRDHSQEFDIELANQLKYQVDHLMRSDLSRATKAAELMVFMGEHSDDPRIGAEGLIALGNVQCIGHGDLETAIETYDKAAAFCQTEGLHVQQARSQIGKVGALSHLGRPGEAFDAGLPALKVLEDAGELELVIRMTSNLGIAYSHAGDDAVSLEMFDRAQQAYRDASLREETTWLLLQMNRSFALRALGRFDEAITAGEEAIEGFERLEELAEAARAREHMALTLYVMGHYNEALRFLDEARESFFADDRIADAALVDLFVSDILLELRRFDEVLEICDRIKDEFLRIGAIDNAAQASINEAAALSSLGNYSEALESLTEAQSHFDALGNMIWRRSAQLKTASTLIMLDRHDEALKLATALAQEYEADGLSLEAMEAALLAAKSALGAGSISIAGERLDRAEELSRHFELPGFEYRIHHLRSQLLNLDGRSEQALAELERSIQEFERLRSRVMIEHRIRFQEDKEAIYVDAVRLAMALDRVEKGFEYAERAKSRALVDLIANRVSIGIGADDDKDQALVEEIRSLTEKRDQLYRHWEVAAAEERGGASNHLESQAETLILEDEIASTWHRLLVRNADYAREAATWTVRTEPVQPYLDSETTLLEYFIVDDRLVAWAVSTRGIEARQFKFQRAELSNLIQLFRLNLSLIASSEPEELAELERNAKGILQDMAAQVLEPVDDLIANANALIVVPHGLLHYIPFHALWLDGEYLIERLRVSYLPSASVLRYCREAQPAQEGALVVGCSSDGMLPHAVLEADSVARVLGGETLLEGKASRGEFTARASKSQIVHVAAHGEFRGDSPLFSGVLLADGWLTALDIFNMRIRASLVTLSACETGESLVAGGDELLGLTRSILSSGAASVLVSLWAVEDRSAAAWMEHFYRNLASGQTKADSLRNAQLEFLQGETDEPLTHPYYWAPFVLVGDEQAI